MPEKIDPSAAGAALGRLAAGVPKDMSPEDRQKKSEHMKRVNAERARVRETRIASGKLRIKQVVPAPVVKVSKGVLRRSAPPGVLRPRTRTVTIFDGSGD
jgi:hypothetical protein